MGTDGTVFGRGAGRRGKDLVLDIVGKQKRRKPEGLRLNL
jgi:hypothetical protein